MKIEKIILLPAKMTFLNSLFSVNKVVNKSELILRLCSTAKCSFPFAESKLIRAEIEGYLIPSIDFDFCYERAW